jgi:hypothetical protein
LTFFRSVRQLPLQSGLLAGVDVKLRKELLAPQKVTGVVRIEVVPLDLQGAC